jgi:hypothetical protein
MVTDLRTILLNWISPEDEGSSFLRNTGEHIPDSWRHISEDCSQNRDKMTSVCRYNAMITYACVSVKF